MSSVVVLSSPPSGAPVQTLLEPVKRINAAVSRTHRRRPCPDSGESDPPPLKKVKKARNRRKKRKNQRKKCRSELRTKPVAPFNTTQFLMAEHDQFGDNDLFSVVPVGTRRPRERRREDSISMESEDPADDDYQYYSSPEDEEEFLTKEFWAAYEDVHAERLDTMTKSQLVQEYLTLEERVDMLERQLKVLRARQRRRRPYEDPDDDEVLMPGEVKVDEETAQKISIFRSEIQALEEENSRLRQENNLLKVSDVEKSGEGSSSSDSSSSDSDSSSDSSSDDSDDEGEPSGRSPDVAPGKYEVSLTLEDGVEKPTGVTSTTTSLFKSLLNTADSGVSCGCGSSSSEDLCEVTPRVVSQKYTEGATEQTATTTPDEMVSSSTNTSVVLEK